MRKNTIKLSKKNINILQNMNLIKPLQKWENIEINSAIKKKI